MPKKTSQTLPPKMKLMGPLIRALIIFGPRAPRGYADTVMVITIALLIQGPQAVENVFHLRWFDFPICFVFLRYLHLIRSRLQRLGMSSFAVFACSLFLRLINTGAVGLITPPLYSNLN